MRVQMTFSLMAKGPRAGMCQKHRLGKNTTIWHVYGWLIYGFWRIENANCNEVSSFFLSRKMIMIQAYVAGCDVWIWGSGAW